MSRNLHIPIAISHVPKTAGTSLLDALNRMLGADRIALFYPTAGHIFEANDRTLVAIGHQPVGTYPFAATQAITTRDPVTRALSNARYLAQEPMTPRSPAYHRLCKDGHYAQAIKQMANMHTRHMGLATPTDVHLVIEQTDVQAGVDRIAELLGYDTVQVRISNVTSTALELPEECHDLAAHYNQADTTLLEDLRNR